MELAQLSNLARSILEKGETGEDILTDSEQYVIAFSDWFGEESAEGLLEKYGESSLSELLELHSLVLEAVDTRLRSAEGDMKSFRERVKAIRAYTDRWPRRISITGKRKG